MRPISRLSDCQVAWLWTEETAVKITPLPLTLCSLQGANSVAVTKIVSFTVILMCVCVCVCEASSLCACFSTLQQGQKHAVRPIREILSVCLWT